jgi:hypothetical protein
MVTISGWPPARTQACAASVAVRAARVQDQDARRARQGRRFTRRGGLAGLLGADAGG